MQKHLITLACLAGVFTSGCSSMHELTGAVPEAFAKSSLVYRPDIQQGNVVDQDAVDKLQPGMSKSQVSYLMGSAMLVDVFHQDRWDYLYWMKRGNGETTQKRVALFFEDELLVRIEGDFRPQPASEEVVVEEDVVITVPDYTGDRSIFDTMLNKVGIETEE